MKSVVYRGIAFSILCAVLCYGLYEMYIHSLRGSIFTVHYDTYLSAHMCNAINTWLHDAQKMHTFYTCIDMLQKEFSCIQSVRFVRTAHGGYDIFVQSKVPRIVWGLQYVVTDNACCLPQEYYARSYLEQLPCIVCNNSEEAPTEDTMRSFLQVPSEIFDLWNIHWKDQTNILLYHKQSECCIQGDSISIHNKKKIEQAYALFCTQHKHSKKHAHYKKRIFDIRFERQILEYVMKGKWNDEKHNVI